MTKIKSVIMSEEYYNLFDLSKEKLILKIKLLQQENKQLKELINEVENKLNEDIQDLNNFSNGLIQPSELIKSLKLYLQILDKVKGENNE